MKKNDLIELLNNIRGNPDIMLWNGLVEDFMDIGELSETYLVKQTFDHYVAIVELEEKCTRNDLDFHYSEEAVKDLRSSYRKYVRWESNSYVTEEDVSSKRYNKKLIIAIDAKRKGCTYVDRLGSIDY